MLMQQLLLLFIEVIVIDVLLVHGRLFDRCELVGAFRGQRPDIEHNELNRWICIAQQHSKFDSASVNVDPDGSIGYHGLFHISDRYWCAKTFADYFERVCHMTCEQLKDDHLQDDVVCVQKVFEEHRRLSGDGFSAWPVSQTACASPPDLISDCGVSGGRLSALNAIDNTNSIYSSVSGIPTSAGHGYKNNIFLNGKFGASTRNGESAVTRISYATEQKYSANYFPVASAAPPPPSSGGKVYDRCELARELRSQHNMPMNQIHTWVCIAQHESNFRTSVIGRLNADGSTDHGLFQISNLFWCDTERVGKACNAKCSDFENSDITDDVRCIRRIHNEHHTLFGNGFNAWSVYKPHCQQVTKQFTKDCFANVNEHTHSTALSSTLQPWRQHVVNDEENAVTPWYSNTKTTTKRTIDSGKVYDRCELAREMRYEHNMPLEEIPTWVCIAQRESNYRTYVVGNGEDHGLFQISSLYWCSKSDAPGNACNARCTDFLDTNIADDVKCVRQIFDEHQRLFGNGFHAWTVYEPYCKHVQSNLVSDCFATTTYPTTSTSVQTAFSSTFGFNGRVTAPSPTRSAYSFGTLSTTVKPIVSYTPSVKSSYPTAYALNSVAYTTLRPITAASTRAYTPSYVIRSPSTFAVTKPSSTDTLKTSSYSFGTATTAKLSTDLHFSPYNSPVSPYRTTYPITTPRSISYSYVSSTNAYTTKAPATQSSVNAIFDLYLNKWGKKSTLVHQPALTTPHQTASLSTPYLRLSTPRPNTAAYTPSGHYSSLSPVYSNTYSTQYTTPYRRTTRHSAETIRTVNDFVQHSKDEETTISQKSISKLKQENSKHKATTTLSIPIETDTIAKNATVSSTYTAQTVNRSSVSDKTKSKSASSAGAATTGSHSTLASKKFEISTNTKKPNTLIEKFKTTPTKTASRAIAKHSSDRVGRELGFSEETTVAHAMNSLPPNKATTIDSGRYVPPPSTKNAGLYTPFSKDSWHPVKTPSATIFQLHGVHASPLLSNLTKASFTASQLTPLL